MRSYDEIDSNAFMNSNSHYRMQAYMVQPFFEDGEGEFLPDHPTMKFIPLENEAGVLAMLRDRKLRWDRRRYRRLQLQRHNEKYGTKDGA